MKDRKKIIVRRIFLLSTGKSSFLTEEEKKVIKEVDDKVTINLLEPNDEDYKKIEKIFSKYF
jgi:hypothetical protein